MSFTIRIDKEDIREVTKRSGVHAAACRRKAGKMRDRRERRSKDAGKQRKEWDT